MKCIRGCKLLFFINLLCMLWLPNSCDIKQNEAFNPSIQTHQTVQIDSSRVDNVPSKEEETFEKLNIGTKESYVQPSVEYVNSQAAEEDIQSKSEAKIEETSQPKISSKNEKKSVKTIESSGSVQEINPSITQNYVASDSSHQDFKIESEKILETPQLNIKEQEEVSSATEDVVEKLEPSKVVKSSSILAAPTASHVIQPVQKDVPKEAAVESATLKNLEQHPPYDGMPSFDEWKKMMLAEQEKGGQKVPSPSVPGKKISSQKRRRNYSSYECGAKIVAANSEAEGTSRILNELVDEYMLNPCKAKIWFVIELCETVQASQIELANFELFSSCPKDFVVYSSDNFPTRDWVQLGSFTAAEQRVLQSFELKQEGFGKFIKIELQSYYGKEHYCPLSVVRIFGTSMVDEYEEMETLDNHHIITEDDSDRLDIAVEDTKSTNLFGSATDAVMNIVKKAAQALGQQQTLDENKNETVADQQNLSETKFCKLIDATQEKCEDASLEVKTNSLSSLPKFSVPLPSTHQSLFRLLHRCDQCVSSHIRYYSSAQPHCRFFQAALGPVVFQTLCDWFKEHPLVITHESAEQRDKKPALIDSFISSPTKSPPPQIMRIRSESDSLEIIINSTLNSVNQSDKSTTINVTDEGTNKINRSILSEKIKLESSIQPIQSSYSRLSNDSMKLSSLNFSESTGSSVDVMSQYLGKSTVTIPVKTEDSDESTERVPTSTVIVNDFSTITELTDSEEQQMNEFFSDVVTASSDDMMEELVTEMPSEVKPSDDKPIDMRSELQGKVEPAIMSGGATVGQKESVFMRMSNRIKALEINMSLSSQYLQELSQRYRRQMEEMQRAFNRTIGTLNDTARKSAEKDSKQQELLNTLQFQVANLSETVEFLLNQRASVFQKMVETHVCLMVIEAIIMITIMSLCVRRVSSIRQVPPLEKEKALATPRISKRRNSADSCTPPIARKVKKRSASEEALNAAEEVLIAEPITVFDPMLKVKKKNRKRNKGIQRSISHPSSHYSRSSNHTDCGKKRESHSDGCLQTGIKSKHATQKINHLCENCNVNCSANRLVEKGRRLNGTPLQNLTNGSILRSAVAIQKSGNNSSLKEKEKFNFKKFLKFQKRDSI